ncbi:hypothetical protein J2R98_001251 [Alkalibacillus filiformis]|uniref:Spore coat protein n=1 Tax=Alkalibacillus filiformis TaxID=200990 RepID=A0ABU0DSK3_9BACI|nr:hypothetical protein [Alkalibacillus filiformis]MDQ0351437.1 hypothetical protein [Alkalibacillus filiformis]
MDKNYKQPHMMQPMGQHKHHKNQKMHPMHHGPHHHKKMDPKHHMKKDPKHHHQKMDPKHHMKSMFDTCHKHRMHLVQVQAHDGQVYDGIIDDVGEDGVTLIMPWGDYEDMDHGYDDRMGPGGGFGPGYGPGYGSGYGPGYGPGYGLGYGHGQYPRRFRRFRRHRFPFSGLSRIFFPFFL